MSCCWEGWRRVQYQHNTVWGWGCSLYTSVHSMGLTPTPTPTRTRTHTHTHTDTHVHTCTRTSTHAHAHTHAHKCNFCIQRLDTGTHCDTHQCPITHGPSHWVPPSDPSHMAPPTGCLPVTRDKWTRSPSNANEATSHSAQQTHTQGASVVPSLGFPVTLGWRAQAQRAQVTADEAWSRAISELMRHLKPTPVNQSGQLDRPSQPPKHLAIRAPVAQ